MDKIKVTISREDGNPICSAEAEPEPFFVTDADPILIVRKDGGTVETFSGGVSERLAFTVRQLEGLGIEERYELCSLFSLEFDNSRHDLCDAFGPQ